MAPSKEPVARSEAPWPDAGVVETALAEALRSEASRNEPRADVLLALTRELEARRMARATNVVSLAARRDKGDGR
jgi:hypothetical protein